VSQVFAEESTMAWSNEASRRPRTAHRRKNVLHDPQRGFTRCEWIVTAGGGIGLLSSVLLLGRVGQGLRPGVVPVLMYASEPCLSCRLWVAHLEAHGYRVRIKCTSILSRRKDELGVPSSLRACHTAVVPDVVVEGPVPADTVTRLLTKRSGERGLAVADMPGGSPGMESMRKQPYDVIAFRPDGSTRVYAHVA
jgi:hypothetical protein